ncbi:MAG: hypothetical protein K0M52_00355 [Pseudomonas sp.]|nr:hypothetical protein [Pseudomonas sp.]
MGNYLGLFALLTFTSAALAEDYYWTGAVTAGSYVFNWRGADPVVGCSAFATSRSTSVKSTNYTSATRFSCVTNSPTSPSSLTFYRYGTQCPAGTVYNPDTFKCDPVEENPCEQKTGLEASFSRSGTAPDEFMSIASNGYGIPQRQGCKDGCAVEITDLRCKTFTAGPYLCRGRMGYTGQQCSTTGTGTEVAEDVSDSVDPETVKEEKPCVYTTVGDKQVCESKKSEENTGESCGEVNGVRTCVPKAPDKNGIDIRTEATTKTNPDGTTTTTKTDTATSTTCKGIKNCTTTKTTVTTTTTKNANGQTTGSNSTCTGPLCPNKSSNPDADGDGFGDCAGGNCGGIPGGPGGSEVGAQDWFTPGEDTFGSVLTEFSQKVQLLPVSVQTTKFLTFNASGACPRWSVSTWVFDFDFDQFCTGDIPWSAIAAVIIAAASFLAFRIAFL